MAAARWYLLPKVFAGYPVAMAVQVHAYLTLMTIAIIVAGIVVAGGGVFAIALYRLSLRIGEDIVAGRFAGRRIERSDIPMWARWL
jgi:uncharacterized membrane protein YqiK